jgi:hypothetical protein
MKAAHAGEHIIRSRTEHGFERFPECRARTREQRLSGGVTDAEQVADLFY